MTRGAVGLVAVVAALPVTAVSALTTAAGGKAAEVVKAVDTQVPVAADQADFQATEAVDAEDPIPTVRRQVPLGLWYLNTSTQGAENMECMTH